MFAQALIYIILILIFCVIGWFWVVKPLLKGAGVENIEDPEPDELTAMQTKRDGLKVKLAKLKTDAEAAGEMATMTEEMVGLEAEIKEAEKEIKELRSKK
jgi:hypothetical protein